MTFEQLYAFMSCVAEDEGREGPPLWWLTDLAELFFHQVSCEDSYGSSALRRLTIDASSYCLTVNDALEVVHVEAV